jgi:hypothetical protein
MDSIAESTILPITTVHLQSLFDIRLRYSL